MKVPKTLTRIAATAPRLKSLKPQERDVARAVKDFMQAKGFRPVRMQRTVIPGQFQAGEPGIPDGLYLHYRDRWIIWIETKRPGGKRSQEQIDWHRNEVARWPGAQVWTVSSIEELVQDFADWERSR